MTTANPNRTTEFSVSYEGSALAEHTMDVRDLAPALLSLAQAFDRANSILNGDRASVNLSIRATRPGSFEILLILDQLLDGAGNVLGAGWITTAANLKELLIGGSGGALSLFAFLKGTRGKKPKRLDESPDGVLFKADHVELWIPKEVALLYGDRPIRDQVEAVVRPLFKPGIDRMVFRESSKEIESVRRDEAVFFGMSDEERGDVTEFVIPRQRLQIASLTFNKDGKWRLSDGANTHWYSMDDVDFKREIEAGKRFGKDDILVCEVLMAQQIEDSGKLKMDYSVKRVLNHIPPTQQLHLPNIDGDAEGDVP